MKIRCRSKGDQFEYIAWLAAACCVSAADRVRSLLRRAEKPRGGESYKKQGSGPLDIVPPEKRERRWATATLAAALRPFPRPPSPSPPIGTRPSALIAAVSRNTNIMQLAPVHAQRQGLFGINEPTKQAAAEEDCPGMRGEMTTRRSHRGEGEKTSCEGKKAEQEGGGTEVRDAAAAAGEACVRIHEVSGHDDATVRRRCQEAPGVSRNSKAVVPPPRQKLGHGRPGTPAYLYGGRRRNIGCCIAHGGASLSAGIQATVSAFGGMDERKGPRPLV
ncbi:hypothetical protein MRX96_055581 [Rhipicephalus microplus]